MGVRVPQKMSKIADGEKEVISIILNITIACKDQINSSLIVVAQFRETHK